MLVMGMAAPSPAAPTELVVTSDTRPKEGRLNDQQTEIFLSKCPPGVDRQFADIADILPISCFSDSDTLQTLDTLLVGKKTYDKVSPVRGL